MCYGHPHHHPCGHQSVKWHYCPRAKIDVTTGHATVCDKTTYAISQPSKSRCPLKHCYFKELGGVWDCCECKQGPNRLGWCTYSNPSYMTNYQTGLPELVAACDHGCCKNCTRSGPLPEDDSKKKKKARKPSAAGGSSSSSGPMEGVDGYAYGYEYAGYEGYEGERPSTSSGRHHKSSSHGKGKGKDKR